MLYYYFFYILFIQLNTYIYYTILIISTLTILQDNDGYVSQQDYKLAKRFDFDGNGVLDADERAVGKKVLAEEFFKRHEEDLHIFGPQIAKNTHKKNVENLVNSYR